LDSLQALEAKIGTKVYHKGDLSLLQRPKVSIVGARRASDYAKRTTYQLANALARRGCVVVSGGAMGIDAMAHRGAGAAHTIAVVASGIDIRYPAINKELLASIEREGLVLSRFEEGFRPTRWSFVVRNEMVVALGEVLVVSEADRKSGSMRSVEYALDMGKPIFVLPHRLGESEGTQRLLQEGKAQPIWDIEAFADRFGQAKPLDEFEEYLRSNPGYEEAVQKFGQRVVELELMGRIVVKGSKIYYQGV